MKNKTEDILGGDHFGFRRGKGTRDVVGLLRIISKQTWYIDEEMCLCFIEWQKAFDHVHETE